MNAHSFLRVIGAVILMLSSFVGGTQVPDAFNFQAVARNAGGQIMPNQGVNVTFRIYPAAAGGTPSFEEDHSLTTNQFGQFTTKIGTGTPVIGTLGAVNWAGNPNWLEVEINGTLLSGRTQLVAVPYALLARHVENGPPESDPQVSSSVANNVPKWNGTTLVDGSMYDNGSVGIGTSTPGQKLHVAGTIRTTALEGDQTNDLNINNPSSINSSITTGAGVFTWYTSGTERMRLSNSGNLGIGTSIPTANLHIVGGVRIVDGNQGAGKVLTSDANGNASWQTAGGGAGGTLDDAYDFGGAGAGRIIIADAGLVSVQGSDGFEVTGDFGMGAAIGTPGPGTRMLFNPRKAAFRAGTAGNSSWDDVNVGDNSVAMGYFTTASGPYSTAIGYVTTASGNYSVAMGASDSASGLTSTAMGLETSARGDYSTAMGNNSTASGLNSTAMGYSTVASNNASTAIGDHTTASGDGSTAMGYGTTASGGASTAMGSLSTASGDYATASGYDVEASGAYSTSIGNVTTASGLNSIAMGDHTTAPSASETVFGSYNTQYTPSSTTGWDYDDRLFVIGNGTGSGTTSDAMVILKSGAVGLGTATPSTRLHVWGSVRIEDGTQGQGRVLTSDSTGLATWTLISGTLDDAYDFGGPGAGRTIIADAGAVSIQGTDGFEVIGTGGTGATIGSPGEGTRMFFNPNKQAFRAGYVNGDEWDDANVGVGSVAMGYTTTASGPFSTALGQGNAASGEASTAMGEQSLASGYVSTSMGAGTEASGNYSTAMGVETVASGLTSTAMGEGTEASGDFSTAMGGSSEASGNYSTAMGGGTEASGDYSTATGAGTKAIGSASVAMGVYTIASGDFSTAMGDNSTASGESSTAMGFNTTANGYHSVAMGDSSIASATWSTAIGRDVTAAGNSSLAMGSFTQATDLFTTAIGSNTIANAPYATAMGHSSIAQGYSATAIGAYAFADGDYSTAMGESTVARSGYETVMGRYNADYTPNSPTGWDNTDRLFAIGNGTSDTSRHNAMIVMKNGYVGINMGGLAPEPAFMLEVIGLAAKPGGGMWLVSSDKRLKQNVLPYTDGLDKLLSIEPVTFNYNALSGYDTSKQYVGVIAQALNEVAPYMVSTFDRQGTEYLSVDNSAMIYMLINAVKEQQAQITELRRELGLEARN
jgi:hypothetical protein